MLVTLGSYIAIALENARLYEDARETERRLQNDLATAREIQRQPAAHRRTRSSRPGTCRRVRPGARTRRRLLRFSSVRKRPTGHSPSATSPAKAPPRRCSAPWPSAFFASTSSSTPARLRKCWPCSTPACMPRGSTAASSPRFSPSTTPDTRRLTLSNAGGPYPLLVRDGAVQSVRVAGIPLGLFPDTQYDEITLDLVPGDTVLFASDGILESANADLEEFGPDRLCSVLSAFLRSNRPPRSLPRFSPPPTITAAPASLPTTTAPFSSSASPTIPPPIFPSSPSSTDIPPKRSAQHFAHAGEAIFYSLTRGLSSGWARTDRQAHAEPLSAGLGERSYGGFERRGTREQRQPLVADQGEFSPILSW